MPDNFLPPELVPVVAKFVDDQTRFVTGRAGMRTIRNVTDFADAIPIRSIDLGIATPIPTRTPPTNGKFAGDVLKLIGRLPDELTMHDKAPLLNLRDMPYKDAVAAASAGLRTLLMGINAVLTAKERPRAGMGDAILHAAFGADDAAALIRDTVGTGDLPWREGKGFTFPDLEELIRAGEIRGYIRTLAECGYAAQQGGEWQLGIRPIGRVVALTPARGCTGDTIEIQYSGFGTTPPTGDILVVLPQRGNCAHVSLRAIAPALFSGNRWPDSGKISVTLPARVFTGAVGFIVVPPPVEGVGPCGPGSLSAAAGGLQIALGDRLGGAGIMIGQSIATIASKVEAGRNAALPCATEQSDKANILQAGPPAIDLFEVVERGGVHPRGTATLRWRVVNADSVEIVARDAPGTENAHELPPVAGPLPINGEVQIAIPCSRRWEGEYVLRARNADRCAPDPVEAAVLLRSMFSLYTLGVGRTDITDTRPGLPMLGFSDDQQFSSGIVDLPQYARAFVIEENGGNHSQRIAMVVADIWGADQRLKTEVIRRLNIGRSTQLYSDATLIIGATHTHSGTGGYCEYYLYNMTGKGYDPVIFERLVEGIVSAIRQAENTMVPGRIYVRAGELVGVGANRSLPAHLQNVDARAGDDSELTDREMLLLKFVEDIDNRGRTRPIGALNWHALHPTNLGMFNTLISGDNKGWAGEMFEDEMAARRVPRFVAAFGNAAAGDVSGNFEVNQNSERVFAYPKGDLKDYDKMQQNAQLQFEHARDLFDAANEEVTGPILTRHVFMDMSHVEIRGQPGNRTWPAAFGVSFGAGSTEDSLARTTMGGISIESNIVEGFTTLTRVPCVAAVAALAAIPGLSLLPAIILGGPPLVLATATTVAATTAATASAAIPTGAIVISAVGLKALIDAAMAVVPQPMKSYITSTIAGLAFPGEIKAPNLFQIAQPEVAGAWRFDVPDNWPGSRGDIPGHGMKPIMLAPGMVELVFTPEEGDDELRYPCPLVPHVIPFHLIRIGQVALAGVPAEFTSTAGRRLKADVRAALGPDIAHAAIFGFANAYSGYVTTPEEYDAQHYEGASTLYGPHTLAAYRQTFTDLATAMANNTAAFGNVAGAFTVPGMHQRV